MSIILKGIDLPKHCEAVEVKFYISDIDVYRYTYAEGHREVSAVFNGEGLDNIVQIPKDHGRIIDEKELKTKIHDVTLEGGALHGCIDKTVLHEVPTILAEEG